MVKRTLYITILILLSQYMYVQYAVAQNTSRVYDVILGRRMMQRSVALLPKWSTVLDKVNFKKYHLRDNSSIAKYTWGEIKKEWRNLPKREKIEKVNALFNAYPYTEDILLYGMEDYWATPKEFLKNSGDCEDYAIIKYYALMDLGIPEKDMRILILIDTIRGIGHAVLLVHFDKEVYLLDNVSELVLPAKLYTHYDPQFSVDINGIYL